MFFSILTNQLISLLIRFWKEIGMKFKIGIYSILISVFMLVFAASVFAAAGDVTATGAAVSTNQLRPGLANVAVGDFSFVTVAGAGNVVSSITVNGAQTAGTNITAAEITRVALYLDNAAQGKVLPSATLLAEKTSLSDRTSFIGGDLAIDISPLTIPDLITKKILVVVDCATTMDDTHSIGAKITTATLSSGLYAGGAKVDDVQVVINPTHLVFKTTGYVKLTAVAANRLSTNYSFTQVPAGTDWTLTAPWTYNSTSQIAEIPTGSLSTGPATYAGATLAVVLGERYAVTFEVKNISGGTLTPAIGAAAGDAVNANGVYTQVLTALANNADLTFTPSAGGGNTTFFGALDNVRVRHLGASANTEMVQNGALLNAVDDYDNLSVTYTNKVKFKAELFDRCQCGTDRSRQRC